MVQIRQIRSDEWRLLKQVRIDAVSEAPYAFSEHLEITMQMPESLWRERTLNGSRGELSFCTLAIEDGTGVGIAVGLPGDSDPDRSFLVSMWVAPQHRGTDVAVSLLDRVIDWAARYGAKRIYAGIKPGNERAVAFYRKCSFDTYDGPPFYHPAVSACDLVLVREITPGTR